LIGEGLDNKIAVHGMETPAFLVLSNDLVEEK
jgi:hypothetical protein